jgi:hypothetical protein
MYILISTDGTLSLEDVDNLTSFSIVENSDVTRSSTFSAMATRAEEGHYWIDADSVIKLSPRHGDQHWVDEFWDMLKKAEPYGYADLVNNRVKAHVKAS